MRGKPLKEVDIAGAIDVDDDKDGVEEVVCSVIKTMMMEVC